MKIHEKPLPSSSRILVHISDPYNSSDSSDLHRDAIRRSEKLSTLRKSRKLKFTSKRFVLYIRKNILVESWLRSCIYTVVNESPQDIMGSFPFTDIKTEMEHSVSEAAVYVLAGGMN